MSDQQSGAAFLSLADAAGQSTPEVTDLWRDLAGGQGVTVSWEPIADAASRSSWGQALGPASVLAKHLAQVVERAGGVAAPAAEQMFRVEVPVGQTIQNLIPAVGGGFRGMTTVGKAGIANHARLIPVAGAATAGGAAVALGPVIGIVALTVGAEMLAQQQLQAKLDAILKGVEGISKHLQQEMVAKLDTADAALRTATAALLDRIDLPGAVGLGPALNDLNNVKHQALGWLGGWERIATGFQKEEDAIDVQKFREDLGGIAINGWDALPANMMLLYRSLALDSRAKVVSLAQVNLHQPDGSFEHFEAAVNDQLAANGEAQRRLGELLWNLATTPLSAGLANVNPKNWRQLDRSHRIVTQLTRAITTVPDAPSLITPENRLQLEMVRETNGNVRILQPRVA